MAVSYINFELARATQAEMVAFSDHLAREASILPLTCEVPAEDNGVVNYEFGELHTRSRVAASLIKIGTARRYLYLQKIAQRSLGAPELALAMPDINPGRLAVYYAFNAVTTIRYEAPVFPDENNYWLTNTSNETGYYGVADGVEDPEPLGVVQLILPRPSSHVPLFFRPIKYVIDSQYRRQLSEYDSQSDDLDRLTIKEILNGLGWPAENL